MTLCVLAKGGSRPKSATMTTSRTILAIALAAAFPLAAGCTQGGGGPQFSAARDLASPDIAPPSVDEELAKEAGVERIIYRVGPVDLPAHTDPDDAISKPLTMRFQADKAMWVIGFKPRIVDESGSALPAELLHQAMVFNMHEENPLCAGEGNPFTVATSLLKEIELPEGYGYAILPTDPLEARVVLANPSDKGYAGVSFELTLVARAMDEFSNRSDVKPVLFELDPCGHSAMKVPPREFMEKSAAFEVPMRSRLIAAQAALQDFGVAVELRRGSDPEPLWRAEALLDKDRRITGLLDDPFISPKGIPLKGGEEISLGVAYDNSGASWLAGRTAAAMTYLAPED